MIDYMVSVKARELKRMFPLQRAHYNAMTSLEHCLEKTMTFIESIMLNSWRFVLVTRPHPWRHIPICG